MKLPKIIELAAHFPDWCTRMFTGESPGVKRGVYTLQAHTSGDACAASGAVEAVPETLLKIFFEVVHIVSTKIVITKVAK
jgi:hypothetical protein